MQNNIKEQDLCYKEMYLHIAKATEDALRILIKAQQECEDMLLCHDPSIDTAAHEDYPITDCNNE